MNSGKESERIELYATEDGIKTIESITRLKILSLLREGELSFDEIVKMTSKAKSTISIHLKTLAREGLISSYSDPHDARKKIFFLKSDYMGTIYPEKLEKDMSTYIERYISHDNDPFEFFRLIFHTIRVSLIREGVDIDPILHNAGKKVGNVLYEKIQDPDLDTFLQNITEFWETHSLGRVELVKLKPLTLNVHDCFECSNLPPLGKPACAFDLGILESLFQAHLGITPQIEEIKCYALGDQYCTFIITK